MNALNQTVLNAIKVNRHRFKCPFGDIVIPVYVPTTVGIVEITVSTGAITHIAAVYKYYMQQKYAEYESADKIRINALEREEANYIEREVIPTKWKEWGHTRVSVLRSWIGGFAAGGCVNLKLTTEESHQVLHFLARLIDQPFVCRFDDVVYLFPFVDTVVPGMFKPTLLEFTPTEMITHKATEWLNSAMKLDWKMPFVSLGEIGRLRKAELINQLIEVGADAVVDTAETLAKKTVIELRDLLYKHLVLSSAV